MAIPSPEPLPFPFIHVPALSNFRDIGGWPIQPPPSTFPVSTSPPPPLRRVRTTLLYRSPDPITLTPAGEATLHALRITTLFDLRASPQIARLGVRELPGIARVWLPVFGEHAYSPERAAQRYLAYSSEGTVGIVGAFEEILEAGTAVFAGLVRHLGGREGGGAGGEACMVHCTTGNNRTGVFVGVLLRLLGVGVHHVAAEYALSNVGLASSRDAIVERLMKNPVFAGEGGRARAERMIGAREESMVAMLDMVEKRWGGPEGYAMDACGLSEVEIVALRRCMVEVVEDTASS
ncbi:hypothetical protein BU16DRAFT_458914 [Lophium mytilinum]|uniref:Tyrosine specific protein phosphatases domain-containing protein n=1 Tax=Lophium mytilinum TaxID=390894 RepID=A0A6A6QWV9_9PEZI|nr:hypothetical protein BU16DRAFT_458914 [Lophium mytilinum]